ncbi:O-antigen ligase family protein [Hymenobacter sp. B81]|uniref:O-antigen ligase family protein n=1 Tax=Hymenobacter sp. B81 TaxID=3344878 RepID=UPI0037DCE59E
MNALPELTRRWYAQGRWSQYLLLLACLAGMGGLLFTARALVALAPVAAVVAALLNPRLRADLPHWYRSRGAWRLLLLYLLLPLSWWYTQDWAEWRHELYRQLPLIGVPLAFTLAVPLTARQRLAVGAGFVLGNAGLGLATLARYLLDPQRAHELINVGQNVGSVTGNFHIHFGLMLALASFFGFSLAREARLARSLRYGLLLAAGLAALSLHVLAYRTGLLAFYLGLAATALLLLRRRPGWALGLLLGAGLLAGAAYFALEPMRQRVRSTLYDLEQFELRRDINDFSLSKRLAAWQTAGVLVQRQPWLGVAPADVRQAMLDQYAWRDFGLRPENRVMIHNQYLHYLVGAGVLGLGIWLAVLSGPFLQPGPRRNPYVRHFLLIFGAAALADSLLQLQIGFNLFVFLYGFLVVAAERRGAAAVTQ